MSRAVLITGASGGIGRAIAQAFAAAGDRVAVHYGGNRAGAEETLALLPGSGHAVVTGDIASPEAPPLLVASTVDAVGGLDVLVNNAALMVPHPIAEVSYEDWLDAWKRTAAVNLHGTANLSFCAAREMIARGDGGRIVNIGSRGAFRGEPDHPAYGATKAAVHAMAQSLAVALAPHGIGVAAVAPGFVATDRVAGRLDGTEGDAIRAQSPFGRVGTPEEVAAAVLWLSSPEAVWASGTVLDVNGASYLRT
ncbi:SDR family NAD(P)-dependent oxidoreductase [Phytomonospora endophytica]|uniref:NAD(P)-dependent dehydrogenase (Short-subunit alcohol dehydrogenase family) n=1 Tax=Phytomonospora endophytica TaxID=714109 RepID=A0A841FM09_9ACTN|nr:SDR family oxidoreductase [Phytomonospora endophytica]MBB6037186.1 NAD(P)-dependent dehydrogenase (short-subunit alcohol dehydrogenase family) [Phytomonospora endophytica]GIG71226.1 NAD-dependent epimerase [Phytomonospora endophytica]